MNDKQDLTDLPEPIDFDWDSANVNKNWIKHQISSKETEEIFFNQPIFINKDVKHSAIEDRYAAIGKTDGGKILHTVFTIRNKLIRIISARSADHKERNFYEQQKS